MRSKATTNKLNRRQFLLTASAAAASLRTFAQTPAPKATALTLHADQAGPVVPANFIGLSYETQQLNDATFFSPLNTGLIEQFRALTPHGVLRLGGNTSDVGWWKPTAASKQPPLPPNVVIVPPHANKRPFQELAYPITPVAVTNLRAFLDATGWTCLYGINLGTSTPERAAEEADFVAKTLGPKLEYFQLGNEPDDFATRFRDKATWNADRYFDEWLASANAIRAAVPGACFGLPDTGGHPVWYATVVDRLLQMPESCGEFCDRQGACGCAEKTGDLTKRPRVVALTHHYYFGGPPANPDVNIPKLLQHSAKADTLAQNITAAAAKLNVEHQKPIPYRMSEGNTCYGGGKPGVSDVFAASLWAADYLLTLASFGYCGVNLHGGSGKMVADSLGGTLPGELLMPDPKAPHPRPFYTPINVENNHYTAEPVYFGMKFAANFAGATMLKLDFDPGSINATAYAATLPSGQQIVAVINKDDQPLNINLPGFALSLTLSAPSLTSTHVSLSEPSSYRESSTVPPNTAILLTKTRT